MRVFVANIMANIARATGGALPDRELVEPLTYAIAERARGLAAPEFIVAMHGLHRQARRIAAFFERHDVWLTPTLAQPPLPIGHFDIESGDVDAWIARLAAFIPFTYPFNVTGQPAASVPLYVERRRPADRRAVRRALRRRGDCCSGSRRSSSRRGRGSTGGPCWHRCPPAAGAGAGAASQVGSAKRSRSACVPARNTPRSLPTATKVAPISR